MINIKNEIRHLIFSNGSFGQTNDLKKIQNFLRGYAETSVNAKKPKFLKSEEALALMHFAEKENLIYLDEISEDQFISAGAEQRVYHYDGFSIIKTNSGVFYEYWLDYFNSLLIHNYFFPTTKYDFLGFKIINDDLHAVVKQEFIITNGNTDLSKVKKFLLFNGFENNRNNDYINKSLGIIFEDLHDENVLVNDDVLFFIDTVFYLTETFYIA
ncbi:putative polyvalent protein kinase domain-containing protein [Pedobacter helvus]|uniref:Uncharacterized protein n=1 Tax=Pedobacter helvus TaxID=2563444 RepID=A0ABW9JGK1_9SPHI|nr:hypothetical protein [Pedobacter ureilyticus]